MAELADAADSAFPLAKDSDRARTVFDGFGRWKEMSDVDQFAAGTSVTAKTRTSRLLGKLRLCTAF
jgi:hypothetical protein